MQAERVPDDSPPAADFDAPPDFFLTLFGATEQQLKDAGSVQDAFELAKGKLKSKSNKSSYTAGEWSVPTLGELRGRVSTKDALPEDPKKAEQLPKSLLVANLASADVKLMYAADKYANATFQVASQFNCLCSVSPTSIPEDGISSYAFQEGQGPASATACAAAALYRNYLLEFTPSKANLMFGTRKGQTATEQLNTVGSLAQALGNYDGGGGAERFFRVECGYTLAEDKQLQALNAELGSKSAEERDVLLSQLQVGVHRDVQVTVDKAGQPIDPKAWTMDWVKGRETLATQVLCSACAVAYSGNPPELWEPLARLVLEAAYEATFLAAFENAQKHGFERGSGTVVLTLLGGGAFGNREDWIIDAIEAAWERQKELPLNVVIATTDCEVHPRLQQLARRSRGSHLQTAGLEVVSDLFYWSWNKAAQGAGCDTHESTPERPNVWIVYSRAQSKAFEMALLDGEERCVCVDFSNAKIAGRTHYVDLKESEDDCRFFQYNNSKSKRRAVWRRPIAEKSEWLACQENLHTAYGHGDAAQTVALLKQFVAHPLTARVAELDCKLALPRSQPSLLACWEQGLHAEGVGLVEQRKRAAAIIEHLEAVCAVLSAPTADDDDSHLEASEKRQKLGSVQSSTVQRPAGVAET